MFFFFLFTLRPCTFGSMFASGIITSSIIIIPVVDARNDTLPFIFGVLNVSSLPLRSTMKPRILLSSHFAHTIHKSATGEFVILKKKIIAFNLIKYFIQCKKFSE